MVVRNLGAGHDLGVVAVVTVVSTARSATGVATSFGGAGFAYWAGAPIPVLALVVLIVPLLVTTLPPLLTFILQLCRWRSEDRLTQAIAKATVDDPDKHLPAALRALDTLTSQPCPSFRRHLDSGGLPGPESRSPRVGLYVQRPAGFGA
jgi:hypothetical protein